MFPKTQAKILTGLKNEVFPGVVYQFVADKTIETHVAGEAQIIPDNKKMTRETLFDVASLTKVVCTTSLILRLYQAGKIDLEAPVHDYLLAFSDTKVTIRQLLTHTADLNTWIESRDQLSADELKKAYLNLTSGPLIGQDVHYTDAGMILLGFLLEEIFGQPLTTLFTEKILQPLGMTHSFFPPLSKNRKVAATEMGLLPGQTHDPKARILGIHAGNAGLFTIVDDLEKMVRVYFGETDFLDKKLILSLLEDQTPNHAGGRSLGWNLIAPGLLYHTGYTGTFMLIDPIHKQAFTFLSNRIHPADQKVEYVRYRDELVSQYLEEVGNMLY